MKVGHLIMYSIIIALLIFGLQFIEGEEKNFQLKDVNWDTLSIGMGNSTCTIVLKYNGDSPCSNLIAELDVSNISENYTTISDSYDGLVNRNEVIYFKFTFDVSSSCKLGWYEVPLKLHYIKSGQVFWEYFNIILTINGNPNLKVSLDKEEIARGFLNELKVNIVNIGDGLARNLIVTIQSQDVYLTIVNESEFRKDMLAPGESWSIEIEMLAQLNIRDGTNIIINLRYEDQSASIYTRNLIFGFKVKNYEGPKFHVEVNNTEISPGKINYVCLIIKNNGSDVIKDIIIKITPATNQLILIGNNTFLRSSLDSGESMEIPLQLYLEPRTYGSLPLYITLNYKDIRDANYQDSITIGLLSKDEPEPMLEINTKLNELNPNAINNVTILIKNIGKNIAKDITINLASQSPQIAIIIGSGLAYIEALEPNETYEIEKQIFIQPNVYGAIPLYAQVSYEDNLRNKFSYTTTIGFEVKGTPSIAISSAYYLPSPVFPGDRIVKVICVVVNNGNYTAQDVEIKIGRIDGMIYPSYAGSDRVKIPFLMVGGTLNIEFIISISNEIKAGYYEVPINIKTRTENYTTSLPLTIYERANLTIERIYFDRDVVPGSRSVKLFLDVVNLAETSAENVRISIISGYITGSTTTVLGSLPGGGKRVVMMEVDISERASTGSLDLDVEISWSQEGRSLTKTFTTSILISEGNKLAYLWIVIPLVLILALGLNKKVRERLKTIIRYLSHS
ncbi:MAG: hypothetical protein NZ922_06085 [Candidatus Methanomethyliaceae archaeon]|nr:hypothetical protein [Candidatus Methanomethyliaceae archaeon]MDW7971267.1 hypothetical protein [Nitrososphaerota archaeon]